MKRKEEVRINVPINSYIEQYKLLKTLDRSFKDSIITTYFLLGLLSGVFLSVMILIIYYFVF